MTSIQPTNTPIHQNTPTYQYTHTPTHPPTHTPNLHTPTQPFISLSICPPSHPSICLRLAEWRGDLSILRALEQGWVAAVHLEWGLTGDVWGTVVALQKLSRVLGAVAETLPVEACMRPVQLLGRVALSEQIDRHDAGTLNRKAQTGSRISIPQLHFFFSVLFSLNLCWGNLNCTLISVFYYSIQLSLSYECIKW